MLAITVEGEMDRGMLRYDVREWAAGVHNLVSDLRFRRQERAAQSAPKPKAVR